MEPQKLSHFLTTGRIEVANKLGVDQSDYHMRVVSTAIGTKIPAMDVETFSADSYSGIVTARYILLAVGADGTQSFGLIPESISGSDRVALSLLDLNGSKMVMPRPAGGKVLARLLSSLSIRADADGNTAFNVLSNPENEPYMPKVLEVDIDLDAPIMR